MQSLRQKTGRKKLTSLIADHQRSRKSRNPEPIHKRRSAFPDEEHKAREEEEHYDSTDSLDQLLDENFNPRHSRSKQSKKSNLTPKRNARMAAGGKRAKAMALMAAKNKGNRKPSSFGSSIEQIQTQNKRQFRSIQNDLCTPAMSRSRNMRSGYGNQSFDTLKKDRRILSPTPHPSRTSTPLYPMNNASTSSTIDPLQTPAFSTLKRSRKVITPTPMPSRQSRSQCSQSTLMETPRFAVGTKNGASDEQSTPKRAKSALQSVGTPLTPTPTKLFKSLNIKTPETEVKRSLFTEHKHEDSENEDDALRLDFGQKNAKKPGQSRREWNRDRRRERNVRKERTERKEQSVDDNFKSWQDIEVAPKKKKAAAKKSKEGMSAFHQLLRSTNALPLPLKWTVLIQKFNALESTLALRQRKSMFYVHHHSLAQSVRQICKKNFVQRDLQEIVSIVPDFYHLQWTPFVDKTAHKKGMRLTLTAMDYDPCADQQIFDPFLKEAQPEDIVQKQDKDRMDEIGIRFLKVAKLKERERVFRVRLVQYLVFYHKQFLDEHDLVEFDPLQTGAWHRKFDLENVADIEISPLPQKEGKGVDEIERMIAEQKAKMAEVVRKELERARQEKELQELHNDPMMGRTSSAIPKHLSHLSPTMVARIRAKERGKATASTKSLVPGKKAEENVDDEQQRLQQLPYLVTLLRGIYISARKSSMACDGLIALIKKRHRNHHIMGEEIWKQLQIIAGLNLKVRFLTIKTGPMVKVAKMNKKVSTKVVIAEIEKKAKSRKK